MADFRSERMPSPEGEGRAKAALEEAWDSVYATNKAINQPLLAAFPWLTSLTRGYAVSQIFDLFGFWVMWRLFGGFDGLQKELKMSRSSVYRRISMFRAVFGEHPDVFEFPGITVDQREFLEGWAKRQRPGG